MGDREALMLESWPACRYPCPTTLSLPRRCQTSGTAWDSSVDSRISADHTHSYRCTRPWALSSHKSRSSVARVNAPWDLLNQLAQVLKCNMCRRTSKTCLSSLFGWSGHTQSAAWMRANFYHLALCLGLLFCNRLFRNIDVLCFRQSACTRHQ